VVADGNPAEEAVVTAAAAAVASEAEAPLRLSRSSFLAEAEAEAEAVTEVAADTEEAADGSLVEVVDGFQVEAAAADGNPEEVDGAVAEVSYQNNFVLKVLR
jgi:phage repressor protein C with HTH and peptisase S24 domain